MSFSRQNGMVLVATLWILAIITLAASYFAAWVGNVVQREQLSQSYSSFAIESFSTRETLLYMLTTKHMTMAGLTTSLTEEQKNNARNLLLNKGNFIKRGNEIALDGTAYRGVGDIRFAIQDEGGLLGLLNVKGVQRQHVLSLMSELGVPADEQDKLMDSLSDYVDVDSLTRLNGAEKAEYEKAGRSGPRNWTLVSSHELREVLGWDNERYPDLTTRMPALSTLTHSRIVNLNTAPLAVLKALPALDSELAEKIVIQRKQRPFQTLSDVSQRTGKTIGLRPLGLVFLPSKHQRLYMWSTHSRQVEEIHIQLTPFSKGEKPWIIEYRIIIPGNQELIESDIDNPATDIFNTQIIAYTD